VDLAINSEQLKTRNFARAGSPDPVQLRILPQIRRSLVHRGVLFLDELHEFGSRVLEVLRHPVEDKTVTLCAPRVHWLFLPIFKSSLPRTPGRAAQYNGELEIARKWHQPF
jgi:hypothetical protein